MGKKLLRKLTSVLGVLSLTGGGSANAYRRNSAALYKKYNDDQRAKQKTENIKKEVVGASQESLSWHLVHCVHLYL